MRGNRVNLSRELRGRERKIVHGVAGQRKRTDR